MRAGSIRSGDVVEEYRLCGCGAGVVKPSLHQGKRVAEVGA